MSPRSFVCRRHKSRGDPRTRTGLQCGQAIVRQIAERPVLKNYYINLNTHSKLIATSFLFIFCFLES